MPRQVLITDYYDPTLDEERKVFAGTDIRIVDGNGRCQSEDDVIALGAEAEALMVQWVPVTRRIMEHLPRCKVIARYAIGIDGIDLEAATERRIMVANVPDYCTAEVSDHAMALILALVRKLKLMDQEVQRGIWKYGKAAPVHRLSQLSLGLIGFGKIAREVARKACALGFGRVFAYDPYVAASPDLPQVSLVPLEELLRNSHVISVHAPATSSTHHLLNRERLAMLRDGAFLVNTSRGAVIDEASLFEAVRAGRLGGVALDVLEDEAQVENHPLLRFENVILTPHIAWYSIESIQELQRKVAEQVKQALLDGRPTYWVNPF